MITNYLKVRMNKFKIGDLVYTSSTPVKSSCTIGIVTELIEIDMKNKLDGHGYEHIINVMNVYWFGYKDLCSRDMNRVENSNIVPV